jgi:hypothetical protein
LSFPWTADLLVSRRTPFLMPSFPQRRGQNEGLINVCSCVWWRFLSRF